MAFGLPVVAFDCENGPRTILSDGEEGFLVPPYNEDMFANRIVELASDEEKRRRMGEAGREKSEKYNIKQIALRWKSLFNELMEER